MKQLLESMVKPLVRNPEEVEIVETISGKNYNYVVRVAESDMTNIIGRKGSVSQAIRTIMRGVVKRHSSVIVKFEGK